MLILNLICSLSEIIYKIRGRLRMDMVIQSLTTYQDIIGMDIFAQKMQEREIGGILTTI